jgi:hypothetical protein
MFTGSPTRAPSATPLNQPIKMNTLTVTQVNASYAYDKYVYIYIYIYIHIHIYNPLK